MMKKFLTFVGGVALGAYVMYNTMFNKAARAVIKKQEKEDSSEKTEE